MLSTVSPVMVGAEAASPQPTAPLSAWTRTSTLSARAISTPAMTTGFFMGKLTAIASTRLIFMVLALDHLVPAQFGNRLVVQAELAGGNPSRLELGEPGIGAVMRKCLVDEAIEEAPVLHPCAVARKARILGPFGVAEHSGHARELALVANSDRDHRVGGPVGRIRHNARMPVAEPVGVAAGRKIARGHVDEHRERRFVKREFHLLALAAAMARVERGEDRGRCKHTGAHVDDCNAVFHRRAVRLAADAHETGLCLQDEVIAGKRGLRAA